MPGLAYRSVKYIMNGILLIVLSGCATLTVMPDTPSVCVAPPEQFKNDKSHICDVSQELQVPPETVDEFLLDASAMAYVTEQIEKQQIADFLNKIETVLKTLHGKLTYNDIFEIIAQDADRSALLMRVINRRLRFYASAEPISEFDYWMIGQAIQHQREQFGL